MVEGTVAHQREMGRLCNDDSVRVTLDHDRAQLLNAISRLKS